MKRKYIKFNDAVKMLQKGCEIYTDRTSCAPNNPLHFYLWLGDVNAGQLHRSTIKKLIKDGIIGGTDANKHDKYKLISKWVSIKPTPAGILKETASQLDAPLKGPIND